MVIGNGSCSSSDHRRRTITFKQSVTQASATAQALHHMAGRIQARST